jgi:hypothetical protein
MSRRTFEEQLAGLPAAVRRSFDRFDSFARCQPGVAMSQLREGRSYKVGNCLIARVDPKANSGDGYLGVQFALSRHELRGRINDRVRPLVIDRPARPSGGHPWIFVRGEGIDLDTWLVGTFVLARRAIYGVAI